MSEATHRQVLKARSGLLLALFVPTPAGTVVSTALPRMPGDPRGSPTQDTWVVTATLGASVLLIRVSFVDGAFAWASWQRAAMVGGSALLLGAAPWAESRVAEPIVPLRVIRQRATAPAAMVLAGIVAALMLRPITLRTRAEVGEPAGRSGVAS
ncbi:membrane transport protein [[Actinomadura] parvosata subsp. kistnae]|uniref:Major facilitator superfamily (MFS) profile domain-containing protein n=1 Tax=[Actinomadura] parvosata subsp. kistnae TaxID=1909395 RepID=A0A1U9ZVH9_9ACTN|nr:hypothetical protein [Nonomuraea sp. ATCC 55076]AQZ61929.1 hypothetical protein BKM31_11000 [Nonomuraea sp. ATCC 55076]SPL99922.1 membrane transport protein [Actinomadura parvosata subsp. kistnae]